MGRGISEEVDQFLGSTANRNPGMYLVIPTAITSTVRLVVERAGDDCGHTYVQSGDRPGPPGRPPWQATRLGAGHDSTRPEISRVLLGTVPRSLPSPPVTSWGTFVLNREGKDFHSTNPVNLFASDDEWTASTMAEVGPDGQVWVIDWYNYIVSTIQPRPDSRQGGGAYETDLRDKTHGRIYRIVNQAAKLGPPTSLAQATPPAARRHAQNSNMFWRLNAQRLLVERGDP